MTLDQKTRESRVNHAWHYLVSKAEKRETVTYTQVADHLGIYGQGRQRFIGPSVLGPIVRYVLENSLPLLPALVVRADTRLPGNGLGIPISSKDVSRIQGEVFSFRYWRSVLLPFTNLQESNLDVTEFPETRDTGSDDEYAIAKVRGTAQYHFRKCILEAYGQRCAFTDGFDTFDNCCLIASHIVPWAQDKSIRLDPRNGLLANRIHDQLFETGWIVVDSDSRIYIWGSLLDQDNPLSDFLRGSTRDTLARPIRGSEPNPTYLKRKMDNIFDGQYDLDDYVPAGKS